MNLLAITRLSRSYIGRSCDESSRTLGYQTYLFSWVPIKPF